ncbi:MAG: hypothetical protein K0S08_1391 [Gammaproteobacteria bacterium]|nr:hypothetical protein [Gammaproteobacteria bacterium]
MAQADTSTLTEAHLKTLEAHLKYVTQAGGVFFDQQVTNTHFRGGRVQVIVCLYRRVHEDKKQKLDNQSLRKLSTEETLRNSRKLVAQLQKIGLKDAHGLRHAYAQKCYKELTGWEAPINGGPTYKELTKEQKIIDYQIRLVLSERLGHSRAAILKNYCGR